MKTSGENKYCPQCGARIPEDAPKGLCPRCVMGRFAEETEAGVTHDSAGAPYSVAEIDVLFPELEVVELIGVGGMGSVFKARQIRLDRWVALKILSRELGSNPAFVERFSREAKVLARLDHPNIVRIYDFGQREDVCYLLMEYVDGVNLRQAMRAGALSPSKALALTPALCDALQYSHDQGALHRDIKPENLFLDTRGRIKLGDFGIAKWGAEDRGDVGLTQTGSVMGTPHYMAPEQMSDPGSVDQRADIYSLGVVFYEMLTGELPLGRFGLPSEKSGVDPRVDPIVLRTLEYERERRYGRASEVKTDVESLGATAAVPASGTQRGGGLRDRASSSESRKPTAKNATVACVLTILSIPAVLATLSVGLVGASFETSGDLKAYPEWMVVGFPVFLAAAALAIPGMVMGIGGMRQVREAKGRMNGLVRCMIAGLTWPMLLSLIPMALGCSMASVAWLEQGALWLIPAIGIPTFLGAAGLIGAWRWARAIPRGVRGKRLRSLGYSMAPVAVGSVFVALIPVLMVVYAYGYFTLSAEAPIDREVQARFEKKSSSGGDPIAEGAGDPIALWEGGDPEIFLNLDIASGMAVTLSVERVLDGEWVQVAPARGYVIPPAGKGFQGSVMMGRDATSGERCFVIANWNSDAPGDSRVGYVKSGGIQDVEWPLEWNRALEVKMNFSVNVPRSQESGSQTIPLGNAVNGASSMRLRIEWHSIDAASVDRGAAKGLKIGTGSTEWMGAFSSE